MPPDQAGILQKRKSLLIYKIPNKFYKFIEKIFLEPGGEAVSAAKIGREMAYFIAITLFPQRDVGHYWKFS